MPSAPDGDLWEALARYSAGESSPAEAARVRSWLEADPKRSELMATLHARLETLTASPADVDVEAALQRVKARIADQPFYGTSLVELRVAPWRRRSLQWAAGIAITIGAAVLWRSSAGPGETDPSVAVAQIYETGVGETDSVRLVDGTNVILAPSTVLRVAADYNGRARAVDLDGEALFDVKHDAARSFTVTAGAATIRDLGTAFTVKTSAVEGVRVAVTVGSVLLHATASEERQGVVLKAGDRGVLQPDGNLAAQPGSVTDADVAWTHGRLAFDNASLTEVSEELKRWYGVDLQIGDASLATRRITASFKGEPVEQVLHVIALTLGGRIERNGNTAILRK